MEELAGTVRTLATNVRERGGKMEDLGTKADNLMGGAQLFKVNSLFLFNDQSFSFCFYSCSCFPFSLFTVCPFSLFSEQRN